MIEAVRSGLASLGDPEIAIDQQRYMKSAMPFRGVRVPDVRALVRTIVHSNPLSDRATWEATILELWDGAEFREERYAATFAAGHRRYRPFQDPDAIPLYEHMVVTGAWWDHVDTIAAHLIGPIQRSHRPALDATMRAWATDGDRWRRRTAIIHQLGARDATDTQLLTDVIAPNLADGDFFIRKGIGWALREYARTAPDWVRSFVAGHADAMSPLSRREATKHL
jgi:3-methyladenine DNA glycosylase AlkD